MKYVKYVETRVVWVTRGHQECHHWMEQMQLPIQL